MDDPAVLELLRAEVEEAIEPLARAFMALGTEAPGSEAFTAGIEQAGLQVDCIRAGAEAGGLPGLEIACERFGDNISALAEAGPEQLAQLDDALLQWPERAMAYLLEPRSDTAIREFAGLIQGDHWPLPLSEHEVGLLSELLAEVPGGDGDIRAASGEPARSSEASPEDVSLAPPDDVNMEVFAAFVDDAPQHAAAFSACLQSLGRTDDPAGTLDQARRIAHTLKGAAGVAGVAGVMNLTHHLEDLLEYLGKTGGRPGAALMGTLMEAADCLEAMIDALNGVDVPPDNAREVLQAILDWANRMDRGELRDMDAAEAAPANGAEAMPTGEEPTAPMPGAGEAGGQSLRVPFETFDALFRFAGELSVAAAQLDERVNRVLRMQQAFVDQDKVIQQRLFELEDLIDIRDVASAGHRMQGGQAQRGAAGEDFDPLEMDEYNELHGVSRMLSEAIADWRELNVSMHDELLRLRNAANQQGRLHRALEDTVLSTRLVPVRTVASRLQRSVRQACRATGKEAELVITGADLPLDTELLQELVDPLGHLLRNAVDHGIELPEDRQTAGKPAAGTIRLAFRRDGNMIEVRCEDDGRGLDLEAIFRRAVERGLIASHGEHTPDALARLVLLPGFSTRDAVTRISGRGVGLDVVHDRVRSLQGTVEVLTGTGAGSTFVLRVPAALVTVHVLLLDVGGQTVAIPSSDLLQVPVPGSGRVEHAGDLAFFRTADADYLLRTLVSVMGRPSPAPDDAGISRPLILARVDGNALALEVDRLLGSTEVVIKRFGDNLPRVRGVLGAAILGDGTVAPVLDLAGLMREPVALSPLAEAAAPEAALAAGMAEVLVVDDSLSVRRSLVQFLQDSGFRVRQARDGIEAVRAVEERHPDLLLVDMEMPRMNGLELTAHLRGREGTQHLPIIMLTSRSMQKHRRQADLAGVTAYLTKPFQETELLDSIEANLPAAEARSA